MYHASSLCNFIQMVTVGTFRSFTNARVFENVTKLKQKGNDNYM